MTYEQARKYITDFYATSGSGLQDVDIIAALVQFGATESQAQQYLNEYRVPTTTTAPTTSTTLPSPTTTTTQATPIAPAGYTYARDWDNNLILVDKYGRRVPMPTTSGNLYTGITETTPTTSGSGYTAPVIPMGGATEDQINYLSNLRRLATQDRIARIQSQQQRSEVATQYEPQIRKAGREIYNQQVKAQASLGARGISGAPGLSVAARRAAMAAPATQRTSLISERDRQLAALERTLTSQLSAYEEEIRRNQEQLTRATTLANQLTGTGQ